MIARGPCSNACVYEYCKLHGAQLRKGSKLPVPCRKYGCGTQSITLLCKQCGSKNALQKLIDTEKRYPRNFRFVLQELLVHQITI